MAALVIESGNPGRDPLADIDRRIATAIEALPGVLAAVAWIHPSTARRAVYIAIPPDQPIEPIHHATLHILRQHRISIEPARIHIAPVQPHAD
ncbi:MAG TPA: hypothetical protein VJ957_09855 [Longimicrobiales bacterium]|nr:hypothetical protein [Longimicrobiales bacterium]